MWVDSKTGGAHAIQSFAWLNWDLNTSYYKILNDPEIIIRNTPTDSFFHLTPVDIPIEIRENRHVTEASDISEALSYVVHFTHSRACEKNKKNPESIKWKDCSPWCRQTTVRVMNGKRFHFTLNDMTVERDSQRGAQLPRRHSFKKTTNNQKKHTQEWQRISMKTWNLKTN